MHNGNIQREQRSRGAAVRQLIEHGAVGPTEADLIGAVSARDIGGDVRLALEPKVTA